MATGGRGEGLRQATTGLLLMAAGVVLLLDQQELIEIGSIWRWWPLAPVAMGIWKITAPRETRDLAGGAELIILGAWLMVCTQRWMGLSFVNSWPLIFVGIGVKLIIKSLTQPRPTTAAGVKEDGHA
ncbi:MAG TPA: DUF5668 domain-containing protein [Candidatus Limnocylindrales bacterium]|nr:DUF5668 domain-containing protein [Candidatus Limnocylindrales bacterium]